MSPELQQLHFFFCMIFVGEMVILIVDAVCKEYIGIISNSRSSRIYPSTQVSSRLAFFFLVLRKCNFMFAFYLSSFIYQCVCVSVCFGILVFFYLYFDVESALLFQFRLFHFGRMHIPLAHKAIWIRSAFLHLFLVPCNIRYQQFAAATTDDFLFYFFFLLRLAFCVLTHHGHVPFMHLLLYLEFGAIHSSQCRYETFTQLVPASFFSSNILYIFYRSIADVCLCELVCV